MALALFPDRCSSYSAGSRKNKKQPFVCLSHSNGFDVIILSDYFSQKIFSEGESMTECGCIEMFVVNMKKIPCRWAV
jgi:hypothetical protein